MKGGGHKGTLVIFPSTDAFRMLVYYAMLRTHPQHGQSSRSGRALPGDIALGSGLGKRLLRRYAVTCLLLRHRMSVRRCIGEAAVGRIVPGELLTCRLLVVRIDSGRDAVDVLQIVSVLHRCTHAHTHCQCLHNGSLHLLEGTSL